MGVSIISFTEVRNVETGKWELAEDVFSDKRFYTDKMTNKPFHWRSYRLFAFLANIRNDFGVTPIKSHDIPEDATDRIKEIATGYYDGDVDLQGDCIYLRDMLDFDYEKEFFYTSPSRWEIEEGKDPNGYMETYREFLGESYFEVIEELEQLGTGEDVRVYCWFSF